MCRNPADQGDMDDLWPDTTKKLKLNKFTLNVERDNIYVIKCYQKIRFELLNSNESEHKMIYIK